MKSSTVLATVLICVLTLSVVAPSAVTMASEPQHAEPNSAGTDTPTHRYETAVSGVGNAVRQSGEARAQQVGEIDPSLENATGTVKIVVRLRATDGVIPADRKAAIRSLRSHAERSQQPVVSYANNHSDSVTVRKQLWLANAVLLSVNTSRTDLREIARLPGVKRLHRNFELRLPGPVNRSDETNSTKTGGNESTDAATNFNTTYGLDQINATAVWRQYGTQGAGATVAVLDTGVDVSHPNIDLYTENASNETYPGGWAEFDENGDRVPGSKPHDTGSHGTHVSGTVSGGNASGQYVGVAPAVQLMHGLVLSNGSGTFTQIISGMQWAIDNNADVISMSLGPQDGGYVSDMIEPVRNAEAAGTTVVAASGNDGAGTSGSPGNVYESIAAGASNENLGIAPFSSGELINTAADWGSDAPPNWPETYVVPDVAAPGVAVNSTVPGGGYSEKSGTSMATPHVAGALALMISAADGELSPAQVKSALYETAFKPANCSPNCSPRVGNDTRYGAGIIDAKAATDRVVNTNGSAAATENASPIYASPDSLSDTDTMRKSLSATPRTKTRSKILSDRVQTSPSVRIPA